MYDHSSRYLTANLILAITGHEKQPGDRRTDRKQSLSNTVSFLIFVYGTIKINNNYHLVNLDTTRKCV